MELSERLKEALNPHEVFELPFFNIPVTDTVIVMWFIMAIIAILTFIFTRSLKTVPEGRQNLIEAIVEFIDNFSKNIIGHYGRAFTPYLGTLLIFLVLSNIISIFSIFPSGEWLYKVTGIEVLKHVPHIRPPTKDVNTTAALAILTILFTIVSSIRYKKLGGWLADFLKPVPLMLPFKILEYLIRPLSLCFRLFGNIMGAFLIMEMVYLALPLFLPAFLSIYFDLFDGILQAYIFVFLSSLYIAEAVE